MEEFICITAKVFSRVNWSLIPNWISAFATLCLAIIAAQGVKAWKKEHKGKLKFDSARKILTLVHQIQGHLSLMPVVYRGDKRLEPNSFVKEFPNEFVNTVQSQAKKKWGVVDPLISDLYVEGIGSKILLGKTVSENIRVMVSYLQGLDPNYVSTYKPRPTEMNSEELSVEKFSERVIKNSILSLPTMITQLEDDLSKSIE